jgi:glycosyltransferase involved in cell wall biosynthesis
VSKENKPAIAIIVPGGIGTGKNNTGVPSLERIVKLLSVDLNVTVFQLFRINENYKPEGFDIVPIVSSNFVITTLKMFSTFRKVHRAHNFSVVHGFWVRPCGFLAVLIGKLWRIKSIVSLQGGDAVYLPSIKYGQLSNSFYKWIAWWTLRQADHVTALTKYLVDTLSANGFTRTDIHVVPFGTDPQLFKFREKAFSQPVKILHIGNLHPVKDQITLLHAFKIITEKVNAQLTIIGEGHEEAMLRKLILKLNLVGKASIQHPVAHDDLPAWYDRSDIMMHTSLTEGQAVVVSEAMSSGVMVCGTRVGLLSDLPECFVTVEPGDYKKLAEEVIKIVNDTEQREQKRRRSLEWASAHTLAWTVSEFKTLYNN